MPWIALGFGPVLLAAGYLLLVYPTSAAQLFPLLIAGYAISTYLAERNMTRLVFVISEDEDRIMIDDQSWWRDEERQIPDAFKYWNGKRSEAWLYKSGEQYEPFVAWAEPLEIGSDSASAAHVAGVRTTMNAAEKMARHRQRDSREMARYGLLAVLALGGLLFAYLAGNEALDVFVGAGG